MKAVKEHLKRSSTVYDTTEGRDGYNSGTGSTAFALNFSFTKFQIV